MTDVVRVPHRDLYEFIIRAGVRLDAQNKTVCSAIMMMHRMRERQIMDTVCNHTLAAAAIHLASKHEEDNTIGIRDVVNVTHRILHPDEEMLKISDLQWEIRRGIAKLEFVILRELDFDIDFEHPFRILSIYLDLLRSWIPQEFAEHPIACSAIAICRDCYVDPHLILDHSPESIAVACIYIVLHSMNLSVPHARDWYEVLHASMTRSKLRRMEEKIMTSVYKFETK